MLVYSFRLIYRLLSNREKAAPLLFTFLSVNFLNHQSESSRAVFFSLIKHNISAKDDIIRYNFTEPERGFHSKYIILSLITFKTSLT